MYSGIILTAITRSLALELDYRKPEGKTGAASQETGAAGAECCEYAGAQEIEFDRLLSLI